MFSKVRHADNILVTKNLTFPVKIFNEVKKQHIQRDGSNGLLRLNLIQDLSHCDKGFQQNVV